MPFGDSRLIGYNCDARSKIVQQSDGIQDARKKLELRACERRIDHAGILVIYERVDYAIARSSWTSFIEATESLRIPERTRDPTRTSTLTGVSLGKRKYVFVMIASVNVGESPVT